MVRHLYHGTNAVNIDYILAHGLTPRGERESRWKKAPSRTDRVYLTDTYGVYFAAAAVTQELQEGAVVEIDATQLDSRLYRPDEDAVAQLMQASGLLHPDEMHEFASTADLSAFDDQWGASLYMLGNIAYAGAIPRSAIRRIARIRFTQNLYDIALRANRKITMQHRAENIWQRALTIWALTGRVTSPIPADARDELSRTWAKYVTIEFPAHGRNA